MEAGPEVLLSVTGLNASYGPVQALWDLDIEVDNSEVVALIGSNGSGKTTTLRAISGLIPSSGDIRFGEEGITKLGPDNRVARGLIQVPEGRLLFPGLSVRSNLLLGAYTRSDADGIAEDLEKTFNLFPDLERLANRAAGNLSGGEQQMCAIGRALMARPKLLMIDELSWGLAPVIVERLAHLIAEIHRDSEIAILLVEQDVVLALELADRAYLLETGRIVQAGPADELLDDPGVRKAYLGI